MMKTLIGVGCSHTQASSFIKFPITGNGYELVTDALKEKYEMEYVTEKWITENLTWMGKLNKNLKYDKILNFGRMGMGIEANIRSLMSYTYKVKDLSNHLIIFLVPEMERKEIIHRKEKSYDFFNNKGYPNYRIDTQWDINDNKGDMSIYFDKFYNEEFESYNFIMKLYYLQDYLELKGAKIFMLMWPKTKKVTFHDWDSETKKEVPEIIFRKFSSTSKNWDEFWKPRKSFDTDYQIPPNILEVASKINWLYVKDRFYYKGTNYSLDSEGLVVGNTHLSERGNEKMAKNMYEALCEKLD
jgi:hypothetical protein